MTTHKKDEFWKQHALQWQASSLSQQQYCQQNNLKPHSLSYHKCKLLNNKNKALEPTSTDSQKTATPSPLSGFIHLSPPQYSLATEPLILHFKSGLSLSGVAQHNIDFVKQLTQVLS